MRIGVDGTCWANARGYGRFTRELLAAMVQLAPQDHFLFFLDEASGRTFDLAGHNVEPHRVTLSRSATEAASADGYRSPLDLLRMSRAVRRTSLDVFFCPSVYTYFPLPLGLPTVVTVHDAIAERFPELTFASPRARRFWNLKVKLALKQASLVLSVSEYAANDVSTRLGVDRDRLRVTGEAPATAFLPVTDQAVIEAQARKVGLPPGVRWFTYVGGFNPHKHVDVIVRAHARLASQVTAPPHLLLVGTVSEDVFHGDASEIRRVITDCGTGSLVHWTGFVPDEDLRALHSGATALLLPSASEGFGLPAVEAAACACPPIATLESPLPQVLEGGGLFVPPGDEDALLSAMRRLHADPELRDRLGRVGHERAAALSWAAAGRAALKTLKEVV
jgi:glycosyltransferase involved in cell wall biosynthesis